MQVNSLSRPSLSKILEKFKYNNFFLLKIKAKLS